jgi:predicted dehydrogenase
MSRHPIRTAIVGYGYMGQIRRRNVESHPDLELAVICDPRLTGADALGVPVIADHRELFDHDIDAVFVCTPNNVTADVVVDALLHRKHVFSEKPPGRNVADVERIIAAERASGGSRLVFGFNHRHHPSVRDAKALVDSGALGRILWLRGVYGKSGGSGFERSWRNDPVQSGGGILIDQGIHMLDLFCFFCGDFEEVLGMLTTAYWDVPVEDNAFVLMRSTAGQIAQLHSSATLWRHTFRLEIGLEKGYLVLSGLLSRSGSYGRETLLIGRQPVGGEVTAVGNPREEMVYYDSDPSWDVQVREFVDRIVDGRPVGDSTSEDALRVMRIIERVYRAACDVPRRKREERT